jgi:ferritin-like protein
MIETILVTFVLVFFGFCIGLWISSVFHRSIIREFLKEMGYDTPEKLRELHDKIAQRLAVDEPAAVDGKPVIKIRLEQHQGVIFAYREDDSTFIGQGNTREDLIASIMHRIRGCTVEIVNGDLLRENNTKTT